MSDELTRDAHLVDHLSTGFPNWLTTCMERHDIVLWNAADLRKFSTPKDEAGQGFPFALAWAVPVKPQIMAGVRNGPNQNYCDEYSSTERVHQRTCRNPVSRDDSPRFSSSAIAAFRPDGFSKHQRRFSPQNCSHTSRSRLDWAPLSTHHPSVWAMGSSGNCFHRYGSRRPGSLWTEAIAVDANDASTNVLRRH